MKHIPNKIYLNIGCDPKEVKDFNELSEVTWCADKINDSDIEYYRKPIWHDLRENPDDLPNNNSIVIVMVTDDCTKNITKARYTRFAWIVDDLCRNKVIEWMDIPPFK